VSAPPVVLATILPGNDGRQARLGGGIMTVRFTIRGDKVRIIGAGYWRRGKAFYEEANQLHG